MKKVKLYVFVCLSFICATLNMFIGGCSSQSNDTDNTDNIDITDNLPQSAISSISSDDGVSNFIEEESTETSDTSETTEPEPTEMEKDFAIDTDTEYGIMEIYVFDIGKADAILITTENHTVMIDTGENKHGAKIAEYLLSRDITEIDYLIITHFHKDHVGGADTIIRNFDVKEIIVPDYGKQSKQYAQFVSAMLTMNLKPNILTETTEFTLDNAIFTVYPPQLEYYDYSGDDANNEDVDNEDESISNENDFSIVISVTHGSNNFLFTGDAMDERLGELLSDEDIMTTAYDYLKVPYHGRYNERNIEFINAIKPQYAVITCSSDSSDGSGDERVVSALEEAGAEVYLTTNGNVYCVSNGDLMMIKYMK